MQWFGEMKEGKVLLSELGLYASKCIEAISMHFPCADVGASVIMPDHVHLLIHLKAPCRDAKFCVSTTNAFGPQSKNLGSVIRGFKIGVTKYAKELHPEFQWQPRYHDHIIRSELGWNAIRTYIRSNPELWDKEHIPWHADATYQSL